ncbi:MAG TPA: YjbH domain-containing protein [bacterium]|nr:YjbH domain-containing protein [bacterium]
MFQPKLVILLLIFSTASFLYSDSSDWGGTGLLRIPDGRTITDGDVRFTFSHSYPYRNYCATIGFLPFLELNGRLVELRDRKVFGSLSGDYGYYKDKVADFKVRLFNEKEYLPSIAAGVTDFHGTQLFFSEYVAASKKIGDFDLTIGYGGNLFGSIFNKNNKEPRELDGIFGGVEWRARDNLSLILEYDPTKELALNGGSISSNWNYGLRWKPNKWLTFGYSYQRGDRHGINFSLTYPFGSTVVPQKPDPPFYGPVDWTPLPESLMVETLPDKLLTIKKYLVEEGLENVRVTLSSDMKTLYIEIENRKYLFHGKAIGRALRVAVAQTPPDIKTICLVLKQMDIPMVELSVPRADYIYYLNRNLTDGEIISRMKISSSISEKSIWWNEKFAEDQEEIPFLSYYIEPVKLESYWNDPSGFFKIRVGPAATLAKDFKSGWSIISSLKFPLYSNISTGNSPINANPVRSDIVKYLEDTGVVVDNLFANRFFRLDENSYLRLSAGYMELQYAGIGGEYLRTFRQGRFALGNEVTWAKKRDYDSIFGFRDNSAVTSFFNVYMYSPELDTTFSAKVGKFLAGDKGVRLDISRDIRGGKVFMWYTKTGTGGFTGPNQNYSDKGIGFAMPVRVLWSSDVRGYYSTAISPWSRDVGQPVRQLSLYSFFREYTPIYIRNYIDQFKE